MPISSAGNRNRRMARGARGVTLVEMLVVVTIIGLIIAILSPSMGAGLDSVRMASATDNVASFLNSAVNRVERRQQAIELVISLKDNKLVLYSNEPGFTRELLMPDGITLEAVLPRNDNDTEEFRRLILLPGASVPGIGVQLINRHNNRRIVRLDPM